MRYPRTITMVLLAFLTACQTVERTLPTVKNVDLHRFMGDWYVIASIRTFIEKDAHNAVESYRLSKKGTIETTFSFESGGFGGKQKTFRPTGFVLDTQSNAVWGMQFIWPFKADYRIAYLDEEYSRTIIARNKRDYVWIMARQPQVSDREYKELVEAVKEMGYDITDLRRVPQSLGRTGEQ